MLSRPALTLSMALPSSWEKGQGPNSCTAHQRTGHAQAQPGTMGAITSCMALRSSSGVRLKAARLKGKVKKGSTMDTSPSQGWLSRLSMWLVGKKCRSWRHLQAKHA
jgi:hypothetical protein